VLNNEQFAKVPFTGFRGEITFRSRLKYISLLLIKRKKLKTGLIIKSTGSWYTVKSDDNRLINCRIKGNFRTKGIRATNPVAVGDVVDYLISKEDGTGTITRLHARKNYLIRRSSNLAREYQIIAANIDVAWLVVSLVAPATFPEFIDRFLVTAEAYRIPAKIIFNKTDLYDDELIVYLKELTSVYEKIGYKCYAVSAVEGTNISDVQKEFFGKVNVVTGNSGVGKSTILNSIDPGLALKTMPVSDYHMQGKHSTTFPEMHSLKTGGYVIDTPGIRGFGVIDMHKEEIYHFFPEIFRIAEKCRFSNCMHIQEPGCAVKSAVDEGIIYFSRYSSYLSLISDENEKYR
jgi:ribosome biogenesis GTPase / thiamine phosphate phosphatase